MSENIQQILTGFLPVIFYSMLFFLVYVETAVLFAFFIPGDTLLFAAGMVVATSSDLNIWFTCITISLAAFLGDQSAYFLGKKYGISYIRNRNSDFLNDLLEKAQAFYQKYGISTMFLARFYPWFRTLVPFLAGVGSMTYKRFLRINFASSISWGFGITFLGYAANSIIFFKESSRVIAVFFIFISILLTLKNYIKSKQIKN